MGSFNLVGYNPCCLYLFWGSSYLWFGSLFKLYVHPFNLSASFFEHFITFWLQDILLFFWHRPGNLSFLWDLVPFNRETVFRKQVWTPVVLIASGIPTILTSQGGEFTSMHPIPIRHKIHSSISSFYICSFLVGCEKPLWSISSFHSNAIHRWTTATHQTEKKERKRKGRWTLSCCCL